MPAHQLFLLLSAVLLFLAGIVAGPWRWGEVSLSPAPSLVLGWFGLCSFVVSTIVG